MRHLLISKRLASDFVMSQEIRNIAKQIGLQCYLTIPRCVTILCDNQIDYNENKNVLKYLNKVPTSNDCFPYEYIDADVNKKLEKKQRTTCRQ